MGNLWILLEASVWRGCSFEKPHRFCLISDPLVNSPPPRQRMLPHHLSDRYALSTQRSYYFSPWTVGRHYFTIVYLWMHILPLDFAFWDVVLLWNAVCSVSSFQKGVGLLRDVPGSWHSKTFQDICGSSTKFWQHHVIVQKISRLYTCLYINITFCLFVQ